MKINTIMQANPVMKAYQKQLDRTEKAGPTEMARDKIEISEQAKDFQVAMRAFKELPEVRQGKIEEIRSQVESGQYKPSAEAVAEKIMEMLKGK